MTKTTSPPKSPRTTEPASLLSQWWTLGTITADRRTTGRHAKVAWVIIDRYRQDFGNGRASVRYIARACDLSPSIVAKACRELVDWGFFSQNVGVGTRPTEFTPNWATVPPVSNASAVNISVLQESNTCVLQGSNTSDISVPPVSHESYLPYPADKAGLQVGRNMFEAAPLAPPSDGLEATAAEPASGGFEEFWRLWPRKHQKAAARLAFGKVDETMHATIIAAAKTWAEHFAKHSTDKRWIPEPANWLAKERWDEDLPIIHDDPKGAAIARAKANAPAPVPTRLKPQVAMVGEVSPFSSFGSFKAEIYEAEVNRLDPHTQRLTLKINLGDGTETYHKFNIAAADLDEQERGRAMLASVTDALDIARKIEDTDELLFRAMRCTIGLAGDRIFITYSPAPANDDHPLEAAA